MPNSRGSTVTPDILEGLSDINCPEGTSLQLTVKITGPSEVIWLREELGDNETKDPFIIPNCPPYFVYSEGKEDWKIPKRTSSDLCSNNKNPENVYVFNLLINDIFIPDAGRYICEAHSKDCDYLEQLKRTGTGTREKVLSKSECCSRTSCIVNVCESTEKYNNTTKSNSKCDIVNSEAKENGYNNLNNGFLEHLPLATYESTTISDNNYLAFHEDKKGAKKEYYSQLDDPPNYWVNGGHQNNFNGFDQRVGLSLGPTRERRTPPQVLGPSCLIALKGEPVRIRIKVKGTPTPSVQWSINGKEPLQSLDFIGDPDDPSIQKIQSKNFLRVQIQQNPEVSCIFIRSVNYDDSGRYVAKVTNDLGTITHQCFLSVEGPPEPPTGAPTAAYIEKPGNNPKISVSWAGSPYDGGTILRGYTLQASINEQEWTDVNTSSWLTFTLENPIPNSTYRFRVKAFNMYGHGPPSPVSPQIPIPPRENEVSGDPESLNLPPVQIRLASFQETYDKHEELGKGRFGIVFRITNRESGQEFAGKFVKCIKGTDKDKVRQEVEIMNRLRHPKLVQLIDAIETSREIMLVTEKINGGELFERVVADDFTLTEFDCVGFMRQICDGVRFMHEQNVMHLDLKPENILCLTHSTYNIKIIDFGLSQIYDKNSSLRVLFGTPEFISPEIINYEPISPASDMWALGVITYVLLSGLSPFMGDNDTETFANITAIAYDFEDDAFDGISEDAKKFIMELLLKRPEKRLTAAQCLQHPWLAYPEPKKNIVIPTDKLKRFIIRRKWQKSGTAIRALGRMEKLSSNRKGSDQPLELSSSTRSSSLDSNATSSSDVSTGSVPYRSTQSADSGIYVVGSPKLEPIGTLDEVMGNLNCGETKSPVAPTLQSPTNSNRTFVRQDRVDSFANSS